MRKYLYLFKAELMSTLQYIANIAINGFNFIIIIYVFFFLWNYIYDDPSKIINGYTKIQMIWYVIITEIIWFVCGGRRFVKKICNDVRSGNIAYNINKPYSYVGYILSSHLGEAVIKIVMYMSIGMILGLIFLESFPLHSFVEFVVVILSMILSITIGSLFLVFLGLYAFYIEDSAPLYWLYSKLVLILGTTFPIEFFPVIIQKVVMLSPIYVISYAPAKMFVDFNLTNAFYTILYQIVYLLLAYGLCELLYMKGVKKINVNGG